MNSDIIENAYIGEDDYSETILSEKSEREELQEILGDFSYSFARDYYENWGGDY